MTLYQAAVLLAAGTLGGIASTVASIASVVSYPVLLTLGLPPLTANVTNTMSLVPGERHQERDLRRRERWRSRSSSA